MTTFRKRSIRLALASICAAALAGASSHARADDLSNLGDDKTMSSLSELGLDTLLDRMFDLKNTSQADREGIRAMRALHELSDPNVHLTNSQRQRHIKTALDGIAVMLPKMNDPDQLLSYAGSLLKWGVDPDVNTLEYWGDNPVTQARLKPVVQMVLTLLDRSSTVARAQANALANNLQGANDPRAALWEHLDNLANNSLYNENLIKYDLMLAVDRTTDAGAKERTRIGNAAIHYLNDFDNPDSSVMPMVHLTTAKISLAKGSYSDARGKFDGIIDNSKKEIVPEPTVYQQYEARYFRLVADLDNKNLDAARAGLDKLIDWQKATLPKDKETQDSVSAAAEMMRYRIFSAEAVQADSPEKRKAADDSAVAVLLKLKTDQPQYASIIDQQILSRMKGTEPVATLNPLMLQGTMNKAIVERNKPEGTPVDVKVLDRGIDAAREIVSRKDRTGINQELNDDALVLIPTLLDREGKSLDAAAAYLDYAEKSWPANLQQAKDALNRTGYLVFTARKNNPGDVKLSALYDHFLEVAIKPPFNHTELTYAYGQHLRALDKPVEATKYFRMVPPSDTNYLNAQYFLLLSLLDTLDTKLTPAARAKTVAEMQTVGDTVKQLGTASDKLLNHARAAHATLIAAELSVEEPPKDPKRALALLEGFEKQVSGLPGEKELVIKALFLRVNAYMALGQLEQAEAPLLGLLDKAPDAAPALVAQLLQQLDKQFGRAQVTDDRPAMKEIAVGEAKLTHFLADWAVNNKDPKIQKMAYQYQVYDAKTNLTAGTLEDDPKTRQANLEAAKATYTDLLSDAGHARYVATLDQDKIKAGLIDPTLPDPSAQVGLAFAEYELKDYVGAQKILGELIGEHRLGNPKVEVEENGQTVLKDNDLYWEANVKYLKSCIQIAKTPGPDSQKIMEGNQRTLKTFLIRGGIPERWQRDFEDMRKEIIPDFVVAPSAAPAGTQPAASAAGK